MQKNHDDPLIFLVALGNLVIFTADDGISGRELWRSDGTAAGTFRLRDIEQGALGSLPTSLSSTGGAVYFAATDSLHGTELWRTDGSASGTILVRDILPGTPGSTPSGFIAVGSALYLVANDGVHGVELMKLSGDFLPPTITDAAFVVDAPQMHVDLTFSESLATPLQSGQFQIIDLLSGLPVDTVSIDTLSTVDSAQIFWSSGAFPNGDYRLTIPVTAISDAQGNPSVEALTFDFFALAADANGDRAVNTLDFNILTHHFGTAGKLFSQGNFDYDTSGQVDSVDFNIFTGQYGKKLPAPAAPASLAAPLFAQVRADDEPLLDFSYDMISRAVGRCTDGERKSVHSRSPGTSVVAREGSRIPRGRRLRHVCIRRAERQVERQAGHPDFFAST